MGKHLANLLAAIVCVIPALAAPLDDAARMDVEIEELRCHLERLWESGDRGTSPDANAMLKLAARLEKKAKALEELATHGNGKSDSVHPESMRRGVEELRKAAWWYDRYCALLYGDLPKDSTAGASQGYGNPLDGDRLFKPRSVWQAVIDIMKSLLQVCVILAVILAGLYRLFRKRMREGFAITAVAVVILAVVAAVWWFRERSSAEKENKRRETIAGLQARIDAGDVAAEEELAGLYERGSFACCVERDSAKAFDLYKDLADKGRLIGQLKTGEFLCSGIGCNRDVPAGLACWRKAAESAQSADIPTKDKSAIGVFLLGCMADVMSRDAQLALDFGADEIIDGALPMVGFAADRGDCNAMLCLMDFHSNAVYGRQDFKEAAKWMRQIERLESSPDPWTSRSVRRLRDGLAAVCVLRTKADGGDGESQYRLGKRYLVGDFVARNYDEAISWYKKAIESKASAVAATVKQETPE